MVPVRGDGDGARRVFPRFVGRSVDQIQDALRSREWALQHFEGVTCARWTRWMDRPVPGEMQVGCFTFRRLTGWLSVWFA